MKKHCETKHSNILNMYISEIVWQHSTKTNAFEKQSCSKVQKMRTSWFISKTISCTTIYKKSNEEQKTFVDDLLLVVVKGLFLLNTIENIWVKWFGFQRVSWLVFPSCKTLAKEVLFCMMKRTLEKFVMLMLQFLSQ
jgi:hypothetical protein